MRRRETNPTSLRTGSSADSKSIGALERDRGDEAQAAHGACRAERLRTRPQQGMFDNTTLREHGRGRGRLHGFSEKFQMCETLRPKIKCDDLRPAGSVNAGGDSGPRASSSPRVRVPSDLDYGWGPAFLSAADTNTDTYLHIPMHTSSIGTDLISAALVLIWLLVIYCTAYSCIGMAWCLHQWSVNGWP